MLTCKNIAEDAVTYLDGPLTRRRRLALYCHLLICKHCRRYLQQLRLVMGMVQQLPASKGPTEAEIDHLLLQINARRQASGPDA